jgi:hypothetical protein
MNRVTEELIRFEVTGFTHEVPDTTTLELTNQDIYLVDNGQGYQKYFTGHEAELAEKQYGYDLEPWYIPNWS